MKFIHITIKKRYTLQTPKKVRGERMQTEIIAHRGASKYAPENTMHAFTKALEMQADAIETDVHLTKDNIPVLMHDERINRTSNGRGYIRDFTYEQLLQFDVGSWFAPKFADAKIITLDEFLSWIKQTNMRAHIELKNNKVDYDAIETIVYQHIKNHSMQERSTVSSFNFESIQRFQQMTESITLAYLTSNITKTKRQAFEKHPTNALHIKQTLLRKRLIRCSKQKNIPLRVFTINKISQMMRCYDLRIKGIFTDVPDVAVEARCNWMTRKD